MSPRTKGTQPRYPIYIPSKGRAETCYTMRALEAIGVPYRAVVEEFEAEKYVAALGADRVLAMPTHNSGVVVTRNWLWDHARDEGHERYWTMDDNIRGFYRFNRNLKTPVVDGTILVAQEDYVERFSNVPIAGMNYFMFASRKDPSIPPLTLNTRVYSNMLIETDARDPTGRPYRWEGFYNEDTDLCLRILKDGLCTILFQAFLIYKSTTMTVAGGNTPNYERDLELEDPGYIKENDGRWKMAEELRAKHPDVTVITRKWNRWQHHVDYSDFRRNKLLFRDDAEFPDWDDNYGMEFQRRDSDGRWITLEIAGSVLPQENEL